MALGAVQSIVKAGITPSYATPLASENISADTAILLHVKSTSNSTVVTLVDPFTTPVGSAPVSPTISLGTSTERMIHIQKGFILNGVIQVQFSVLTGVTAGAFKLV